MHQKGKTLTEDPQGSPSLISVPRFFIVSLRNRYAGSFSTKAPSSGFVFWYHKFVVMERVQHLDVPPYFDGSDYGYWKARMEVYLKSIDERVWMYANYGWAWSNNSQTSVRVEDELSESQLNSKGLNAIFKAVSPEEFKRIYRCRTSHEAWYILQRTHEAAWIAKKAKIENLKYRFEKIRMQEDETFDEFYVKLNDIVNSSFKLGERIPKWRIVRKVLRSLPKRFSLKITYIEESKDFDSIKIEELVGSLQTYEKILNQHNRKFLGLKILQEELNGSFEKFVISKKNESKKNLLRAYGTPKCETTKDSKGRRENKTRSIQCHGCSGYGHMRIECPNYLKFKRQAMNAFLGDESESDETEENGSVLARSL